MMLTGLTLPLSQRANVSSSASAMYRAPLPDPYSRSGSTRVDYGSPPGLRTPHLVTHDGVELVASRIAPKLPLRPT